MVRPIIFLAPIFKEMIWGGSNLKKEFGYDIPSDKTGECWAIAAHKNGDSLVVTPEYFGHTLSSLYREEPSLFGFPKASDFPLLIKIIDARDDLSIQVHPDDDYAFKFENGSRGKTECWYVLDCKENATIIVGHNAENNEALRTMIHEGRWTDLLKERPISKGDFFQINSGTIHAIKNGTMILEIQQNSDITYRLYDYQRKNDDGSFRQLHTNKALDVIKTPYIESKTTPPCLMLDGFDRTILVSCPYYVVEKISIKNKAEIEQEYFFMTVSVIEGSGFVDGRVIAKGDHFILPYQYGIAKFTGKLELIISYIL